jgi:hypothetical protein
MKRRLKMEEGQKEFSDDTARLGLIRSEQQSP